MTTDQMTGQFAGEEPITEEWRIERARKREEEAAAAREAERQARKRRYEANLIRLAQVKEAGLSVEELRRLFHEGRNPGQVREMVSEAREDVAAREAAANAGRERRKAAAIATYDSRMPARFAKPFTWDERHAPVRAWIADPTRNLILWGKGVGTGKSHLLWQIGKFFAVGQGRWVVGWSMPDLNEALRPGGDEHALEDSRDCDVLILDELGAERVTEWTLERLFMLVNHRWERELPIVCTTNLDPGDSLADRYDLRIADRLLDGADLVQLAGASRREPRSASGGAA